MCWEVAAVSGRADQAGFAGGALYQEQDDGRKVRVFRVGGQRLCPPSQETVPTVRITPIIPVLSRTPISVSTPISCLSGKGELRFLNRVFWRNDRTAGQRGCFDVDAAIQMVSSSLPASISKNVDERFSSSRSFHSAPPLKAAGPADFARVAGTPADAFRCSFLPGISACFIHYHG